MNLKEWLPIALLFAAAIAIPLVGIALMVIGKKAAPVWLGLYLSFLFFFPNKSYGTLETVSGQNFYTRGTGLFFFSAINLMLFGLFLQSIFARSMEINRPVPHNLRAIGLLLSVLLTGHLVVGLVVGQEWTALLSGGGLINVANAMIAFFVITSSVRDRTDVDRLVSLLLWCTAVRGIWGVLRFFLLGGDPANFYANFQKIDVKLTFFDINDGLLATMAIFIAAWRLVSGSCATTASRLLHIALILLETFIVVFSYRRTAWGGLALALAFFAMCQPVRLRTFLLLVFPAIGAPLIAYKLSARAGSGLANASLLERALPDIMTSGGGFTFTTGRFAELYAAWLSFKESPLFGIGAWGSYDATRFSDLAWRRGDFGWMHSGVLHIALKSGLVGLTLCLLVFVALARFVAKTRLSVTRKEQGVLFVGVAGILFMVPTLLVGTPVIEYRTMQLLALCIALPYLAAAATATATATATASSASTHRVGLRRPRSPAAGQRHEPLNSPVGLPH
jgi:hypothetical protein